MQPDLDSFVDGSPRSDEGAPVAGDDAPRTPVTRLARVPDRLRLARYLRAPELGPAVLFFSGGSALRGTSRTLTAYTHNSIHLITPFDSGGSSARLREAFPMISVGDLRNRLMALADTRLKGHPKVYRLFAHRFPKDADRGELREQLEAMVAGQEPLVAEIPSPLRKLIRTHLGFFLEEMPHDFDLRGASIGNLVLTGGYLNNDCNIDAVLFLFSKLVEVRGLVRPIVDANLHLAGDVEGAGVVVGQHRIARRPPGLEGRIQALRLSATLEGDEPARAFIDRRTRELIAQAELICFPMGSFFTSVLACLLPEGVGKAVSEAGCPKVYVPNCGPDPEQAGLSVAGAVERILRKLRRDAGPDVPVDRLLHVVLVDSERGSYEGGLDREAVEALGVRVVDTRLVTDESAPLLDATLVVEALLSLV